MVAIDFCEAEVNDDAAFLLLVVKEVARFDVAMEDANLLQAFKPNKQL